MSEDRKRINLKMKLKLKTPSEEYIYVVIGRCISCLTHVWNRRHFIFSTLSLLHRVFAINTIYGWS